MVLRTAWLYNIWKASGANGSSVPDWLVMLQQTVLRQTRKQLERRLLLLVPRI